MTDGDEIPTVELIDLDLEICEVCKHMKFTMAHDWRCDEILRLRKQIPSKESVQ